MELAYNIFNSMLEILKSSIKSDGQNRADTGEDELKQFIT